MGKYKNIQNLSAVNFRRLTGVKRTTFDTMLDILSTAESKKLALGGKPHVLSLPDRLLMWLEYLREYRTYFHVAQSYGISESACYRTCVWIEDTLIQAKQLKLPNRKAALASDFAIEAVLVDATESPIERPQKNNGNTTLARKRSIPSKPS
jgi:hypothetical protein